MNVLALDIAEKTGWCIRTDTILKSGVKLLKENPYDHPNIKLMNLDSLLNKILSKIGKIDLVAYEEHDFIKGVRTTQALERLKGVMLLWCEKQRIPYMAIKVHEIKQEATGKGGGKGTDKEAVYQSALSRWPDQNVKDDNQADALFIMAVTGKKRGFNV